MGLLGKLMRTLNLSTNWALPFALYIDEVGKMSEEKLCTNIGTDYDDTDQFICSRCGIHLQNWVRVEIDEDDGDETHHEYSLRYCPNCGARVKE